MLHNVDNNSNTASRLIQQDSLNSILGTNNNRRGSGNNNVDSNFFIDSSDISNRAMKMYERELDIKKFVQLSMSDPENDSHNTLMQELFDKGIVDVFEDNVIESIADNKSLLEDLGL